MNDIYKKMLSDYDLSTAQQRRNAVFEVNQQIVLAGLNRGGCRMGNGDSFICQWYSDISYSLFS